MDRTSSQSFQNSSNITYHPLPHSPDIHLQPAPFVPNYVLVEKDADGDAHSSPPLNEQEASVQDDGHTRISSGGSSQPLHATSLPVCILAMLNTILGAGMLGLPHAFAESGYILGVFMLAIFGCFSAFALHLLSCCSTQLASPCSFYTLTSRAIPRGTFLVDLAIAIKCFGVGTSYLIVIGDVMPAVVDTMGGSSFWTDRRIWYGLIYSFRSCASSDTPSFMYVFGLLC